MATEQFLHTSKRFATTGCLWRVENSYTWVKDSTPQKACGDWTIPTHNKRFPTTELLLWVENSYTRVKVSTPQKACGDWTIPTHKWKIQHHRKLVATEQFLHTSERFNTTECLWRVENSYTQVNDSTTYNACNDRRIPTYVSWMQTEVHSFSVFGHSP